MRIINEDGQEIKDPDLSIGTLVKEIIVKPNAEPIDNKTKFVWADEDYEEIQRYVVIPIETRLKSEIDELKKKLSDSDYVAAKAIDKLVSSTNLTSLLKALSEIKKLYSEVFAEREERRNRINKLEDELVEIDSNSIIKD